MTGVDIDLIHNLFTFSSKCSYGVFVMPLLRMRVFLPARPAVLSSAETLWRTP